MELAKLNEVIQYLVGSVVFCGVGGYILVRRRAVVEAMVASNDVLWGRLGFRPRASAKYVARIMIPLMGAMFFSTGLLSLYRLAVALLR